MSRKNKNKRNKQQNAPQRKKYVVTLEEWKNFEAFQETFAQIQGLTNKLSDEWKATQLIHPTVFNLIKALHSTVQKYSNKTKKASLSVGFRPPKGSQMMAEILIEEIFDDL